MPAGSVGAFGVHAVANTPTPISSHVRARADATRVAATRVFTGVQEIRRPGGFVFNKEFS
jgi:hypothetical protein